MESNRLRRVAAVVLVLAVGAAVVWTLASLNATAGHVSAAGADATTLFGGSRVSVAALAVGAVVLAAGGVLLRRTTRVGRAPPERR